MTIASKVARPFLLVLVGMFVSSLEARRQVDERYYQDMKWRRIYLVVAIFLTGLAAFAIAAYQDNAGSEARLTGVITFLYYEDFERASRFYGEALGLPKTYDRDDVEVFSVTASASVGIIDIRRRGPDARVAPGDKSAGG